MSGKSAQRVRLSDHNDDLDQVSPLSSLAQAAGQAQRVYCQRQFWTGHYIGACLGQPQSNGLADASAGTGDDGNSLGQIEHRTHLSASAGPCLEPDVGSLSILNPSWGNVGDR